MNVWAIFLPLEGESSSGVGSSRRQGKSCSNRIWKSSPRFAPGGYGNLPPRRTWSHEMIDIYLCHRQIHLEAAPANGLCQSISCPSHHVYACHGVDIRVLWSPAGCRWVRDVDGTRQEECISVELSVSRERGRLARAETWWWWSWWSFCCPLTIQSGAMGWEVLWEFWGCASGWLVGQWLCCGWCCGCCIPPLREASSNRTWPEMFTPVSSAQVVYPWILYRFGFPFLLMILVELSSTRTAETTPCIQLSLNS